MAKKAIKKAKPKKKRLIIYKVVPFNIHIKGPNRNKGYAELYSKIESKLNEGSLIVKPNSKGVVVRCLSGKYNETQKATVVSLLKYNENATGLAYDLAKEVLIKNTTFVTAQVVQGVFFHEHHIFMLLPKPHGPSDSEIEEYLEKIFELAVGTNAEKYSVNVRAFKQKGVTSKIENWDVIKCVKFEVFRNNPLMNDVANNLSEIAELLESDKLEIVARTRAKAGINKENIKPLLEAGDKLSETGQARVTAEGVEGGTTDFVDTKEEKNLKLKVKSYENDEGGLVRKMKEDLIQYLNRK